MTAKELIEKKLKRLVSVPDDFVNGLPEVEKAFNKAVLTFISQLEQDASGRIIINKRNIELLAKVQDELKKSFLQTNYVNLVNDFIQQFDKQGKISDDYLNKVFDNPKIPTIAKDVLASKKETALNLLLSDNALESEFINPIKEVIDLAVTSGASFMETLNAVQDIVTGTPEVDSKILRYSKQVTYDSFAVADRAYAQVVADSIKAEWYKWAGDIIPTSRSICVENHDKYFHKKEIEKMASREWSGKMEGTNEQTIFSTAGGYNCQHSLIAVSIFIVPKEVVERAIGEGFYKPSKYEIEKLGLAV